MAGCRMEHEHGWCQVPFGWSDECACTICLDYGASKSEGVKGQKSACTSIKFTVGFLPHIFTTPYSYSARLTNI